MLGENDSRFFKRLLASFYSGIGNVAPRGISKREFGFGDFERKIRYRHYSFRDEAQLRNYLAKEAPPFVSYSMAEYERPDGKPMESKGWLGADLVFDIDASDLKLKCRNEHPSSWVCSKCLEGAKAETTKLIEEFLIPDFGFAEKGISVNFSGNRGYHIHVEDVGAFKLGGDARKQISDYITGNNIMLTSFFPTIGRRGVRLEGPRPSDSGWGGKLANGVIKAVNSGTSSLMDLGIEKKDAQMLTRKSAEVVLGISTGNWDKINIPKKGEFWANVLKNIAIKQSDAIDRNVSTDIYHLIRLPGTIHGDTGLVAKKVRSFKALADFDPMSEAIAFGAEQIAIRTTKVPAFTMAGTAFGPYENAEIKLPAYAASYLVLKGFASLDPKKAHAASKVEKKELTLEEKEQRARLEKFVADAEHFGQG
ncbi:MAG: DNA primase catalytic subunit PriS [Candidatus Micrarchaeaceae archaeon]|nr:DNA primase catalytic subunit PriS [Candidatus Micrarchaeota archaeon]HII10387.1 DNA primase catalytic subunit PriS [Candidatus Micrarchaeota archaeon]